MCDVCCTSTRADECLVCNFRTCKPCARTWYEHSARLDPACPQCHSRWDLREQQRRFGKVHACTSVRKLRRARLLQRELLRMHNDQGVAERERQIRFLRAEIRRHTSDLQRHDRWNVFHELRVAQRALHLLQRGAENFGRGGRLTSSLPCSHPGCRSLVVDEGTGTCGLCGRDTCLECGSEGHPHRECDANDRASMALILRECKSCPACGAFSVRTEGCAVMWCQRCHEFWHWDTRRTIEPRGGGGGGPPPHNPDHREWLAEQTSALSREVDDIPCGGCPDGRRLNEALRRGGGGGMTIDQDPSAFVLIGAFHALVEVQRIRRSLPRHPPTSASFRSRRVAYLLGEFPTDAAFAASVERHERTLLYRHDVGRIFETFVHCTAFLLQRACHDTTDCCCCPLVATELLYLRHVINTALVECGTLYGRKWPVLQSDWSWSLFARRRTH